MTKLQEEVVKDHFKTFSARLQEFINDDATGAHAEWGKMYDQVAKAFLAKNINIITETKTV